LDWEGKPRAERLAAMHADPAAYVIQEHVERSSVPVWQDGRFQVARLAVRGFATASDGGYTAMRGGLARITADTPSLNLSAKMGEQSKDTWILANEPVSQVSLLPLSGQPVALRRSGAELPSRVAEHLYWLGRQMERADGAARLLRAVVLRLTSETNVETVLELPVLIRALAERGYIEPGFVVEGIRQQLPTIERALPDSVFDAAQAGSLRAIVSHMLRLASVVRDRMSLDSWRIIHRIDDEFQSHDPRFSDLSDVLSLTNEMIVDLAAFGGMVMESMTRTQGWRFLDLGRRLERCLQTASLLRHTLVNPAQVQSPVLEAVVDICDSLMSYHSRYLANLQLNAVVDLLLTDESNPRSVVYQLAVMADHVDRLPRDSSQPVLAIEQRLAMSALQSVRMMDVKFVVDKYKEGDKTPLRRVLVGLESQLPQLSDAITHRYLIHAGPAHLLQELRPE
jgi:uncharacterized alpha-E superfamily protein